MYCFVLFYLDGEGGGHSKLLMTMIIHSISNSNQGEQKQNKQTLILWLFYHKINATAIRSHINAEQRDKLAAQQ